jgi:hypothetical protein
VTRDVGDGETQDLVGHGDVVEEVAAHRLHRLGTAVEVELAVGRRPARQDGGLDLPRLLEDPLHAVLPDLLVEAVAQDAEREEDVVPVMAGGDVEGQDVLLVPHLDGGELLYAEEILQAHVHPRIVSVHGHRALLQQELDRRIGDRHLETARHLLGVAEDPLEHVVVAAPPVEPAAVDPQVVAQLDDDAVEQRRDVRPRIVGLHGRDHLLHLFHQHPVVDRADVRRNQRDLLNSLREKG